MNYQDAWKFLDDLQFFKIKLGLDSMRGFLESLGEPQEGLNCIHIGGTNGKGSTAVTLLTILQEAGCRVGMYTSPHLSSVRERFRINDRYISEEEFARHATRIQTVLDGRQITYFEFTTTLAFLWFKEQQVDVAILEVGMGGRLDATNVITPLVSVVTNVSMDHEAYLGDTLALVSAEKAGIIKAGVPVVSAVEPGDSMEVISQHAREKGAPLYLLGRDFSWSAEEGDLWTYHGIHNNHRYGGLRTGLQGRHQKDNASLALAVLDLIAQHPALKRQIPEEAIRTGLARTCWPGRLELIVLDKKTGKHLPAYPLDEGTTNPHQGEVVRFLLDGAHNPGGVASLKQVLEEHVNYDTLIGVWASMSDKDIKNSLLPLAPLFDRLIFTRPESERSAVPEAIRELLPETIKERTCCRPTVMEAIDYAQVLAGSNDLICVAGSLYLVGAVRALLLGGLVP